MGDYHDDELLKETGGLKREILDLRRKNATSAGMAFDEKKEAQRLKEQIDDESDRLRNKNTDKYSRPDSDDMSGIDKADRDAAKLLLAAEKAKEIKVAIGTSAVVGAAVGGLAAAAMRKAEEIEGMGRGSGAPLASGMAKAKRFVDSLPKEITNPVSAAALSEAVKLAMGAAAKPAPGEELLPAPTEETTGDRKPTAQKKNVMEEVLRRLSMTPDAVRKEVDANLENMKKGGQKDSNLLPPEVQREMERQAAESVRKATGSAGRPVPAEERLPKPTEEALGASATAAAAVGRVAGTLPVEENAKTEKSNNGKPDPLKSAMEEAMWASAKWDGETIAPPPLPREVEAQRARDKQNKREKNEGPGW
jgi:hypothetical protein